MNWVEPIKNRDKIARIKDNLRKKPRDYLLFVLGINVALRASDLLGLTVGDVLDDEGNVRDRLTVLESNRKKRRVISLSDSAKGAITFYLDSCHEAHPLGYKPTEPLFASQKLPHGPITRTQAYRLIKKWCEDVELTGNYGTHSLRRTWGYWSYKEGVSIDAIWRELGHGTKKETLRYIGIDLDKDEKRVSL